MFLVVTLSHLGNISTVYVIEQTQGYRCTYSPAGFLSRTISRPYRVGELRHPSVLRAISGPCRGWRRRGSCWARYRDTSAGLVERAQIVGVRSRRFSARDQRHFTVDCSTCTLSCRSASGAIVPTLETVERPSVRSSPSKLHAVGDFCLCSAYCRALVRGRANT